MKGGMSMGNDMEESRGDMGHGGVSRIEQIAASISRLKEGYLDCRSCPPERSCCVFKGDYVALFSKESLLAIAGMGTLGKLLQNRQAVPVQGHQDTYLLANTRCPALKGNYLCKVHQKKAEYGLTGCIEFPIWYSDRYRFSNINEILEAVIADYRCYSVETGWEQLMDKLIGLRSEFGVMVGVRSQRRDRLITETLNSFESARLDGLVPPQMRY